MAFTLQKGAKPHWPELFKQIIRNDNETTNILAKGFDMTQEDWRRLKELRIEKAEYRRGAEEALHWNKDKGDKGSKV